MSASRPSLRPLFDWVVDADGAAGVSTVVASGELDLAAADELAATLAGECRTAKEIRIDLSRVTFVDAQILGVLARAHQDLRARAGRLVLTGVGERIRRLVHITGLDDLLPPDRVA